jgi:hypothetical protein
MFITRPQCSVIFLFLVLFPKNVFSTVALYVGTPQVERLFPTTEALVTSEYICVKKKLFVKLRSDKTKKNIFTSLLYNVQTVVHLTIIQLSPICFLHSIPHTGSPRTCDSYPSFNVAASVRILNRQIAFMYEQI